MSLSPVHTFRCLAKTFLFTKAFNSRIESFKMANLLIHQSVSSLKTFRAIKYFVCDLNSLIAIIFVL